MVSRDKWYRDGLTFECTQCGNCCTGSTGYVWSSVEERRRIAEYLEMGAGEFSETYTRRVGFKYSLKEIKVGGDWDCIFLVTKEGQRTCRIYPVRPLQCRTWPFWTENLRSRNTWESASQNCPGMNAGQHYDFVQIEVERQRRPD